MTRRLPRLLFVAAEPSSAPGDGVACMSAFAAERAAHVAAAARRDGLTVCALVAGSNRDVPGAERVAALAEATGRAVHRVDARLMPVPALQRIVERVAGDADLCLVIAPESLNDEDPLGAGVFDLARALEAPLVLCADLAGSDPACSDVRLGLDRLRRVAGGTDEPALVLATENPAGRLGGRLEEVARGHVVVVTPPRGAGGAALDAHDLEALLRHARRAAVLPSVTRRGRRHVRARIGILLDECFDLYDEESLAHFEAAGAELVPFSSLEPGPPAGAWIAPGASTRPATAAEEILELDGVLIGDGAVTAHSTALAEAQHVREALRTLIEAGAPTLACGGGFAYLTEGLRTLRGAMHPFLGVLGGHAVAIDGELPRGHVEVELEAPTLLGPAGARLRGYVQRRWLVRDLAPGTRADYRTLSGPPDVGASAPDLLALHFRAYWPSHPGSATAFVDRCLRFAARRDAALAGGSLVEDDGGRDRGSAE